MAASSTDKITNTASTTTSRPQATQVTSTRAAGVLTLAGNSFTGWPTSTDSKVHFCTYKLNTSGAKIAGSQIDMEGILSGTTIGSIVIRGGTDVGNAVGDIIEMAPTAAWAYDLYTGLSVSHNKDGSLLSTAVQTAIGIGGIVTSNLATNGVTADKLATSAITLGYAPITASSATNNTTTPALVTGLSTTVTIPAGGRKVRVTVFAPLLFNATVNGQSVITIWDGTVGSGTQIGQGFGSNNGNAGTAGANSCTATAIVTPSAGSKTYNVGLALATGSNAQIYAATGAVAYILVEAI